MIHGALLGAMMVCMVMAVVAHPAFLILAFVCFAAAMSFELQKPLNQHRR